jgi:predicted  nucleic acid-binding Zn-ribbon protein
MIEGEGETMTKSKTTSEVGAASGFFCQECGHKFKTIRAAERASFGPNGCPRCGGSDIDMGNPNAPSLTFQVPPALFESLDNGDK